MFVMVGGCIMSSVLGNARPVPNSHMNKEALLNLYGLANVSRSMQKYMECFRSGENKIIRTKNNFALVETPRSYHVSRFTVYRGLNPDVDKSIWKLRADIIVEEDKNRSNLQHLNAHIINGELFAVADVNSTFVTFWPPSLNRKNNNGSGAYETYNFNVKSQEWIDFQNSFIQSITIFYTKNYKPFEPSRGYQL